MDLRGKDLTNQDFAAVDLSGEVLAHSTITGCKFGRCVGTNFVACHGSDIDFSQADLSNATFEKADQPVLDCVVGATWNRNRIDIVGAAQENNGFWFWPTNQFLQVGCMQHTWESIFAMSTGPSAIAAVLPAVKSLDANAVFAWWQANATQLTQWYSENGAK